MPDFLRFIFIAVCVVGLIIIAIYVWVFFICVKHLGFNRSVFKSALIYAAGKSRVGNIICVGVMVFTLVNFFCFLIFGSHEIGAFYEKSPCYETRECIVDYWGEEVFGLAVIRKELDFRESYYYIDALYLPHGLSFFHDDCPIDIKDEVHDFNFGAESIWVEWDITLHGKATSASLIALENSLIHDKGEFCAIPSSDVFHRTTCRHVKKSSSLIYIEDAYEAYDIFELMPCETCCNDSIWE